MPRPRWRASRAKSGSVLAVAVALAIAGVKLWLREPSPDGGRITPGRSSDVGGARNPSSDRGPTGAGAGAPAAPRPDDSRCADALTALYEDRASGVEVECSGRVKRVLPDDTEPPRHERFIVALGNGRTVLIAHNIDLAARGPVREGDEVAFRGEFEYSENGGVVHWTHRDPARRREGGWIRFRGKTYE